MADTGFTISKLLVSGPSKPDAVMTFSPGLNVVAGASNTGKTYLFQAIDFMLGASRNPKTIPEAIGYAEAYLQLNLRNAGVLTLRRSLQGGAAEAFSVGISEIDEGIASQILQERHEKGNVETISGQLLTLTGLFGREVRTNARGEKRSLSFRDVAWLSLIDEERIITDRSPALSGQYTDATVEQSVFGLFLSGLDDASIIPQEKPQQRKVRVETELALLSQLLAERETRFTVYKTSAEEISGQRARLRESIQNATHLMTATQADLDSVATIRDEKWSEVRRTKSRRLFLSQQIKRLGLLREYYMSDHDRLESSLEAGAVFEQLPTGACPVCGHISALEEAPVEIDARLAEFQSACRAEIEKIGLLLRDLDQSEKSLQTEDDELLERERELNQAVAEANIKISQLLDRKRQVVDEDLSEMVAQDRQLSEAQLLASEITDFQSRFNTTQQSLSVKVKQPKLAKKVETSTTSKYCEILAATLKAWKFPFQGNVTFDVDRFDVVIGNQNRGNLGKGYRAVTHAAFTVALMRYCREEGYPHPGIVVLDTPLNPFKGPDKDSTERVNQEVQEAFYSDLAADKSGDQFIVFENTEPPINLLPKITYEHYSGSVTTGRYGFFPV